MVKIPARYEKSGSPYQKGGLFFFFTKGRKFEVKKEGCSGLKRADFSLELAFPLNQMCW